jgi:hydroxymethylpyrimidine kinase/phosphomethylpyrimidine kinase
MRIALSVAGSDPTGGAGIQMDLQVFRTFGVHGAAAITALTIQDTERVHQVLPVFPSVIGDQLRRLLADVRPDAIKLGMLASDDVLRNVDLALDRLEASPGGFPPLVIDPVLLASDGTPLLERRAWGGLARLSSRAVLVTPNRPEAEELTGIETGSRAGTERAARYFVDELGAGAALVKGGHASGDADDCLAERSADGVVVTWFEGARIAGDPVHGTGCALSAAITARLALGDPVLDAVERGRRFVRDAISGAHAIGSGARVLGFGAAVPA